MGKVEGVPPLADIESLRKELLADPLSNMNNIVPLLKYISSKQPKVWHLTLLFTHLSSSTLLTRCGRYAGSSGGCCTMSKGVFPGRI